MSPSIIALVGAVAMLTLLAGCSTNGTIDEHETTPRPTIKSTPVADYIPPTGECIDGVATLTADVDTIALPEGCATVNVLTNASVITLGPVTTLNIEGRANQVTVGSVDRISVHGRENVVRHDGSPKVSVDGKHNSVKHIK